MSAPPRCPRDWHGLWAGKRGAEGQNQQGSTARRAGHRGDDKGHTRAEQASKGTPGRHVSQQRLAGSGNETVINYRGPCRADLWGAAFVEPMLECVRALLAKLVLVSAEAASAMRTKRLHGRR